jgi:hypothetical protein
MSNLRHHHKFNPEMFDAWAMQNPQAASMFYARAGDENLYTVDINRDDTFGDKTDRQIAQERALYYAQLANPDAKPEDLAVDYSGKVFEDVTREWAPGDTFKIGTPQTQMGGIGDFIEHNPVAAIGTAALIAAAPALSGLITAPGAGAVVAGGQAALTGGDVEDILKASLTGGVTGGALNNVLPGANWDNFAGALARGGWNEVIATAINEGDLASVDNILKGAATNLGFEMAGDIFKDADMTKEDTLTENDLINGEAIKDIALRTGETTEQVIERFTNTSDMMGLLGDNGFLDQIGLDVGYLPTDWLGDGMNAIGMGRPVSDPGGKFAEKAKADMEGISADTSLTYAEKQEQIKNILDQYAVDTMPYDERFFDITSPRGTSTLTGIWTESPNAFTGGGVGNTGWLSGGGGQGTTVPMKEDAFVPGQVTVGDDSTPPPVAGGGGIGDQVVVPPTGGGDLNTLPPDPAEPTPLPPGGGNQVVVPPGGDPQNIPPGSNPPPVLPTPGGQPGMPPPPELERIPGGGNPDETIIPELPGGGGGGGGGGGIPGMMGVLGGDFEWGPLPPIYQIAQLPWDSGLVQAMLASTNNRPG